MSTQTLNLTENLYRYLLANSLREPEILTALREETAKLPQGYMEISPEQGQLMALLTELLQPKKLLEIGVYTGYSSLAVMLAAPVTAHMVACDVSREWTDIAKKYWQQAGVADRVSLHLAPAEETLNQLLSDKQANSFDFAFIDADKKKYDIYYEKTLELLRPGGFLMIDNVLQNGRVAEATDSDENTVAIRALNQKILRDERVSISMLPISDGVTLAKKR